MVNDNVLSNKTRDYSEHYNILFTLILIKSHIIHRCTVIQWSYSNAIINLKKELTDVHQLSILVKVSKFEPYFHKWLCKEGIRICIRLLQLQSRTRLTSRVRIDE